MYVGYLVMAWNVEINQWPILAIIFLDKGTGYIGGTDSLDHSLALLIAS